MAKKSPGRPTKLTPTLQARFLGLVTKCVPPNVAAVAVGLSPRTLSDYRAKGSQDDSGPYAAFVAALDLALAESEANRVLEIVKAAEGGSWAASAHVLSHRFPERWSSRWHHYHEFAGSPVTIQVQFGPSTEEKPEKAA